MDFKKKPCLCYMTFPLSSDPKGNKKKAVALALSIMAIYPNLTILLAHNSTQYTEKVEAHRSILGDIAIIRNVDLVILGRPLNARAHMGFGDEIKCLRNLFLKRFSK